MPGPAKPGVPRVQNPSETTLDVEFDAVEGAATYEVEYKEYAPEDWSGAQKFDAGSATKVRPSCTDGNNSLSRKTDDPHGCVCPRFLYWCVLERISGDCGATGPDDAVPVPPDRNRRRRKQVRALR